MNIRSRLLLYSISLLLFPAVLIAILAYTLHFRFQWDLSGGEHTLPGFLARYYGPLLFVVLALAVLLTLLTAVFFLRSLIRPLKRLTYIANEIENGNLDLEIRYDDADEFTPVFAQFDRMRIHVKDLLWQKVRDEQTRIDMIANIAHDFKTPVTSIQGYAQGLLDGVASSPEKKQHYLQTIIQKSADLSLMANELHLLSTLENKTMSLEKTCVPAVSYFEDILTELGADYPQMELSVNNKGCSAESQIFIDPHHSRRVFANILQNSMKYQESEKTCAVTASVRENPLSVIYCLTDNGSGVSEEDLPHIFDRFYRADNARQSGNAGSGLGLSIARQVINAQGGKIWGRNSEEGGLSVYISFPKYGTTEAPPRSAASNADDRNKTQYI